MLSLNMQEKTFGAEEILQYEGDLSDNLYIILKGKVELY